MRTVAGLGNASLNPVALSDHAGEGTLFVPADHSMGSLADYTNDPSLADWKAKLDLGEAKMFKCEVKRLDSLVEAQDIPRPDFIKCDVEGAEIMVFTGGRATLNSMDAPIILLEALAECARGFGLRKTAAIDFLAALPPPKYKFFEMGKGARLLPLKRREFKVIFWLFQTLRLRVRNSD